MKTVDLPGFPQSLNHSFFTNPSQPANNNNHQIWFEFRCSELDEEPREDSRARNSSEYLALLMAGIGIDKGLRASPILEYEKENHGSFPISM